MMSESEADRPSCFPAQREHDKAQKRAERAKRNAAITEALLAGKTQVAIAREHGLSIARVSIIIKEAREEWAAENARSVNDWVTLSRQRLEKMLEVLWPLVLVGDPQSIDRAIKINAEMRQLLGLNKAIKIELEDEHAEDAADFDRRINQIINARQVFPDLEPPQALPDPNVVEGEVVVTEEPTDE